MMNLFRRIGCRVYQTAFRIALPVLPYREPELFDDVEEVVPLLQKLKLESVLLVTDKTLREQGITKTLEAQITQAGIRLAVYDGVQPNPTVHNVEAARNLYIREKCQGLIAFGGGSSIDCAKAVGAGIAYPKKSLNQMKGLLKVWRKIPTLIAIPTTAGTGSEVTVTAVITDSEKNHKYTMNNFTFIPSYAVLDPKVTVTLPPHLTATTGMDALTHAVEAYIGRSTTQETRAMALEAVRLIFGNLSQAYRDGSDLEARRNMLKASYLVGNAFTQSYVGYVHAVAHSLGGQYNIPHGLANAVLLPVVLEAYGPAVHPKLCELAVAAGIVERGIPCQEGAERFIRAIWAMNGKMGIPTTFSQIQKEHIPQMAAYAAKEANPLYPVPVLMDAGELEIFYEKVMDRR